MTDSHIIQNAASSTPITNIQPPPEGTMAASVELTLTPAAPTWSNNYQLSSQGGLLLSQVVTLCVDNTENAYPIVVTHGALAEVVQVAAFATAIIPTFSTRVGYRVSVAPVSNVALAVNLDVTLIFLNYVRPSGTFSATSQSTIIATGQNTTSLYSNAIELTGVSDVSLLGNGNYILDSLDFALEGLIVSSAGAITFSFTLFVGSQNIQSHFCLSTVAANTWTSGAVINCAGQRTWPQGLICQRGAGIGIGLQSMTGSLTAAIFRVNLSGINTP